MGRSLPNIAHTFQKIDDLITGLSNLIGLSREVIENRQSLEQAIHRLTYQQLHEIRKKFNILRTYWANIAMAFDQRTSFLDTTQFIYGVSRIAEKTIGREMFYVAADNLTKAFVECFNLQNIPWYGETVQWDGFTTFAPPVEEDIILEIFVPESLNVFHVCISEEIKHCLSCYILISHEIAHLATAGNLTSRILSSIGDIESRLWDEERVYMQRCLSCPLNPHFQSGNRLKVANQLFTDIIALKISGPHYVHVLTNHLLWPRSDAQILVRVSGLLRYMRIANLYPGYIESLKQQCSEYIRKMTASGYNPHPVQCVRCWFVIGSLWAEAFHRFDRTNNFSPIAIQTTREFSIEPEENERLKRSLSSGVLLESEDPRKILHSFCELLNKGEFVNFATTLNSLAFNTFRF